MSSDLPAVVLDGVGKYYLRNIGAGRATTLAEAARGALRRGKPARDGFWALADISLEIAAGSLVGIIGRNGAGKSTLLKILSRITEPTVGEVRLRGSVGSLLEVGTGFHPELTGRENVYLNGSLLGMRRADIRRQFDAIVDFSGVETFLDTPVKRYSSGMYVRLAFAVAAHLSPQILIVDEVLAVGDAEFQRKCLGKMESVAHDQGRTVLFVSHNFAAVAALCERAILLDHGRVWADGPTTPVLQQYMTSLSAAAADGAEPGVVDLAAVATVHHGGDPILQQARLLAADGRPSLVYPVGAPLTVEVAMATVDVVPDLAIGISIDSDFDQRVADFSTRMHPAPIVADERGGAVVRFDLPPLPLPPGRYHLSIALQEGEGRWVEGGMRAVSFTVADEDFYGSGYRIQALPGSICLDFAWHQVTPAE